jgi:type IV pilus assembly protein PilV
MLTGSHGPAERTSPRHQGGFTLLEVMIAVLVFAIGMLTTASLQLTAKRANYESLQRTTASQLAFDMLERIRANTAAMNIYTGGGQLVLGGGSRGAEPAPNCDSVADACTAGDVAVNDLWQWEQLIDGATEVSGGAATGGLVSPTACVRGPAGGAAGTYVVAIAWRGVSELENPVIDDCGSGSGLYGANDELRRVVVVRTFVGPF